MKVITKKLEPTRVQLDIEVGEDIVKKKFNDVYEQIGKEAKVPGFRPGTAPRDVLEKHHKRLADEEVIKHLIPDVYKDSVDKEKINAVDLPAISDVRLENNTLSFKATVEIVPDFEVKDYKKLKLKYKKVSVAQDEIEKTLKELKGLHRIENIDDKFARGLGYLSAEALRSAIERQLFLQKENDQRYKMQDELIKQLTVKVDVVIPRALINRRLEELANSAKLQMLRGGATKEQVQLKEETLKKELFPDAEEQVKTFLVMQEIAKKENIPHDDNMSQRVVELLLREADWVYE